MTELRLTPGTEEIFELIPGTQYVYDDKGIIAVVNFIPENYETYAPSKIKGDQSKDE